jgi:Domain of unknown function (DUF4190)
MNPYNTPEITQAGGNLPKTSGAAIASLVCGILGFLTGPITGIPALITGHIARKRIRNSGGTLAGSGMALTGLILGYTSTVVVFVPLLIGWIWVYSIIREPEKKVDFVPPAHVESSR